MRKKHLWKAVASSLLAFSLVVSACPVSGSPFVETVEAAELETVAEWNFDSDTGTDSWEKNNWSSTGLTSENPTVVAEKLEVKQSYKDITDDGTFLKGGISKAYWGNNVDYSAVKTISYELYCKTDEQQPTSIGVELSTVENGDDGNNYQSSYKSSDQYTHSTVQINGVNYTKYEVKWDLSTVEADQKARAKTTQLMLSVVRGDKTFEGTVYFDNILVQKEAASESGGTTGVVYEDNSTVTVTATANMTDWPDGKFEVKSFQGGTLPAGTVLEYDMEVENQNFTSLYWETDIGWVPLAYETLNGSNDFVNNKRHAKFTLDKEYVLNQGETAWGVEVKTGESTTDYVGPITCSALKITLPSQSGGEPETDDAPVSPAEPLQSEPESVMIAADSSWPTFKFTVPNGGAIRLGTTIEYDVVVASNTFNKLYLETDVKWIESDVRTLKGSDFTRNADGSYTKHVTMTYVGEKLDSFDGVQVKIGTGDGRTDYLGTISIKNLTYNRAAAPAAVDESAFVTSSLYSGSTEIAGWGYAKVTQSVPKMAENGYFRVEYDASEKTNVRLVLCQWNTDKNWVQVRPSKTGKVDEDTFFAEYSYDACKYAFGSTNLSAVNEICVTVYAGTGIALKSVIWKGPKVESNPGGNYDSGSSDTSSDDKKETDKKDEDNKNEDNKDDNTSSAPVITQSQGQNHAVEGHEFVVTKGGEDGKAEVAFMDAPTNAKKVVIPKTVVIDGVTCKVTSIAAEAFKGNTKLTNVTIGSNITKIGDEAFAKCTSLTKVTVPASVTEIGEKAFYGCKKVQTVTIGKKVTTIEASAFEKCTSLKKVVISDSVKKIESKAFNGCKNLKKITITSTKLKTIGSNALKGLDKNAVIDVPDNMLKAYKKLFTAKTGFKKTMKLI